MAQHSPEIANLGVRTNAHPYAEATVPPTRLSSMQRLLSQLPANVEHLQCRYRSKVCPNIRARKRDGSLHRYCEQHRQRANANQKIWAQRRMQAIEGRDEPVLELPPAESSEDFDGYWQHHTSEPIPEFSATDSDCELLWQALGLDNEDDENDL